MKLKAPVVFSLALMMLSGMAFPRWGATRADFPIGNTREYRLPFEVLIDLRRNPSASALLIAGVLTIDVNRQTGSFQGKLTPTTLGLNGATPVAQTSVLFNLQGGVPVPDPNVKEVEVRGQITGRAFHLIMLNVTGKDEHVFGAGTAENDPGPRFTGNLGVIGGSAVGPKRGDKGEWGAIGSSLPSQCVCGEFAGIPYCICF